MELVAGGFENITTNKENKMPKQGKASIIKKFLESGDTAKKVTMGEMMEFKKASTNEEWTQYAKDSAVALGIPLEDVDL